MLYAPLSPGRLGLARLIYPGHSARALKKRLLFLGRSLVHHQAYQDTQALFASPHFQPVLRRHLRAIEKAFKPYLMAGLSPARRFALLAGHYRLVAERWDQGQLVTFLKDGLTLAELDGPQGQGMVVRLAYLTQFQREGELTLVLEVQQERFYSATFSLVSNEQGQTGLRVGCLQGPGRDSSLGEEQIRALTRHCHGIRPKALMVQLLSILAQAWSCRFIEAVSNKGHIFASRRYQRKGKLKTDYDALWAESGGVAAGEALWQLPLLAPRKDLESVASKKRSQYRKRYQWLDELAMQCQQHLPG
ncbi:VirK/YbjX family protein [Gallaecimonas xiamenensis]|uniref:DUF535 domain-containing protein n=1 Tax=Gallaecimonas xiamenensis 3-C-1 TaxID=745411 RepID=K2K1Q2_9GAMM|nr:VirK/YbjX family protein [Gallaecimonas xiamenensis]EKE71420.1 hypothetical protein B3C1_12329 [Gallaecimonas xiamenensis 3-C-1]